MQDRRRTTLGNPTSIPIIIGVTGHRDIASGADTFIRAAVKALLTNWRNRFGPALHVMTALADGADQLVAKEAAELGIRLIAVSPMPLEVYRKTLKNPDQLDRHWKCAALKLELPPAGSTEAADYNERQYEQLGVFLARRSHLLLALWDGTFDPKERGGTGAVARMRLEGDRGADVFRDSPLFRNADSFLSLINRGPLLRVVTPRGSGASGPGGPRAGECFLSGLPGTEEDTDSNMASPEFPVPPDQVHDTLGKRLIEDFRQIDELNRQIGAFSGSDTLLFRQQRSYLNVKGLPEQGRRGALELKWLQAAVDTATLNYQRSLMGSFVPERSLRAMMRKGVRSWRVTKRVPTLGIVSFFAAAVPVGVLCFEAYAHLKYGVSALLAYLVVFGGGVLYHRVRLANNAWQNRFQDYRALAEAIRVQLFWALAAVPAGVCDHYLSKQSGELGWIQFALRGPAVWGAALAGDLRAPCREVVRTGWIEDQLRYFRQAADLHEHVAKRGRKWIAWLLYLGIFAASILFASEFVEIPPLDGPGLTNLLHRAGFGAGFINKYLISEINLIVWILGKAHECHHQIHSHAVVLAALLPALAALFTVSRDLRAYEPHAHSYAMMRRIFARSISELDKMSTRAGAGGSDGEFQTLVRELGRQALAENAEWLADHRDRPIENR